MKFFFLVKAIVAAMLLAGCVSNTGSEDMGVIETRLSGKTLVSEDGWFITLGQNGRLMGEEADGSELAGVWEERDGQFCRTLTLPESFAGTACNDFVIEGDQVTVLRADGSVDVLTIQGG